MRVQLHANRHARSDNFPDLCYQVPFAVVVIIGDHGAMQIEQYHIRRERGAQIIQDLVP